MKLYLSSYKLGNKAQELPRMMTSKRIAYIPNASDYSDPDVERNKRRNKENRKMLQNLGLEVETLDLKNYFGKTDNLKKKLGDFGGVFIRGGNTFILRQAMRLSGFDQIFPELSRRNDFVYAGYSAGICVLAPSLKPLGLVDDPSDRPYELQETIWKGLGFLDYIIIPHYKSNHPESEDIDRVVEYAEKHDIAFRTLRDGEVIIMN